MQKIINLIKENKILSIILLVSAVFRIYKLDFQSLWMDEIYTLNISNPENSFNTIITEVNIRDGFPYLYFFLLKFLHLIFGYSAIVARMLSVFGGLVSIYLIYKLTKKLINKEAALIAAAIISVNHYHIYISQEARPYSLYFAIILLVYYRLWCFLEDNNYKNTLYYALSAGLLLNINFFGFINLFSQAVFLVFYLVFTKTKLDKELIKKFLIIGVLTCVLFLPNIQKFLLLFGKGEFWVPKPTNESFTIMLKEIFSNSEFLIFLYTPIFYYLLNKLFIKEDTSPNKKNSLVFGFLLFWIFPFLLFLLVKSYGEVSLILTRYFTSVIPVIFIIIAWGVNEIRNKFFKNNIIVLIVVFSIITLVLEKKYYNSPNKAQFREASNTVIENNAKKQPVFTSQKYWFDYYFKPKNIEVEEIEFENLIQTMIQDSTKIRSFWYVDAFGKTYQPSENSLSFINKNFVIEKSFDGFQGWAKNFVLLKELPQTINLTGLDITKTYSGDGFMNNIEIFEVKNNTLSIMGWAYFNDIPSEDTKINLALITKNTQIENVKTIFSQSVNRPDVTTYFKCNFNADNSGFKADFNIDSLEKGEYKLAIYIENKKYNKRSLFVSEKIFNK